MYRIEHGWVERVYRMLAEGRIDDAMDEFWREFNNLNPPTGEKRLAAMIEKGRNQHG